MSTGTASFYGEAYRGRTMANGEPFDPDAMTAASWDYTLGTLVQVTHAGRSVVVTITDRGPARWLRQQGRIIDLSEAAFARLAPVSVGVIEVTVADAAEGESTDRPRKSPAVQGGARGRER